METLIALLVIVAIAAFLVGIVWVIVSAAKNISPLKPVLTVFAGFILFIFALVISSFSNDEAASTSSETLAPSPISAPPTPVPTVTPIPVPIRAELSELIDEYEQNKVRANARLRYLENDKRPASTSGYVAEVEELYVAIAPEQSSSPRLRCYYADIRAAFHLTRGQPVSVTGKISGEGGSSSGIVMFECEIEGMDLAKNPAVSAQSVRSNTVQVFCNEASIFSGYKGTGVIIDPDTGMILTVHHVVSDENDCKTIEVEIQGLDQPIPAEIVKHCASIDRARIRVSPESLSSLSIQPIYRAAAPAHTDQEIYFWGYGPGELRMENGVVMETDFIMLMEALNANVLTDAYAVPGDSGSPVFNEYGHLLGTISMSNRSDRAIFTGDECE